MRIVIVGAGATGAFLGARMARAGVDVTLVARGAHLAVTYDLWITATALPDPLVSVFIPLALESGTGTV